MEPEQDYLTCGECNHLFPLNDIVKFIQHKINRCNKENVDPFEEEYEGDEDDDESVASNSVISNRRTSISAPIAHARKANTPDKLSPRPPVSLSSNDDLETKSDHSTAKPQCQDASANTVTSGGSQ